MSISYVVERREFNLLWEMINDKPVPEMFKADIDPSDRENVIESLRKKGLMYLNGQYADIERTMLFLISQAAEADRTDVYKDISRIIFHCPKLIICIERDRLSIFKYCIVPLKDEEELNEYIDSHSVFY